MTIKLRRRENYYYVQYRKKTMYGNNLYWIYIRKVYSSALKNRPAFVIFFSKTERGLHMSVTKS